MNKKARSVAMFLTVVVAGVAVCAGGYQVMAMYYVWLLGVLLERGVTLWEIEITVGALLAGLIIFALVAKVFRRKGEGAKSGSGWLWAARVIRTVFIIMVVVPSVVAFLPLVLPSIFIAAVGWILQRMFWRRMAKQNRVVAWDVVRNKLEAGEGTLFIMAEGGNDFWWTNENVMELAKQTLGLDLNGAAYGNSELLLWCKERYFDRRRGIGKLAAISREQMKCIQRSLPDARVLLVRHGDISAVRGAAGEDLEE